MLPQQRCLAHPNNPDCGMEPLLPPKTPLARAWEIAREHFDLEEVVRLTTLRVLEYGLETEWAAVATTEDLFEFSLQNGCIELLQLLYEGLGYRYDFGVLERLATRTPDRNRLPTRTREKFFRERRTGLEYLYDLRKHSRMCILNGRFYYALHRSRIKN